MIRSAMLVLAMGLSAGVGAARALPPLSEQTEINEGLLALGIADELRKQCDRLTPRYVVALGHLQGLKQKAVALGYSDAEIDAYVSSKTEKAKMRARGEAILAAAGVRRDAPETFCTFGLAEIEKRSLIGSFLRAR